MHTYLLKSGGHYLKIFEKACFLMASKCFCFNYDPVIIFRLILNNPFPRVTSFVCKFNLILKFCVCFFVALSSGSDIRRRR